MSVGEAQKKVAALHAEFCGMTGRALPLRYHERSWYELLRAPEYEGNAEQLGADVRHLVRYLQREIAREKRNPGALKLINFLEPSRYFEDLAEARMRMKGGAEGARRGAEPQREAVAPAPVETGKEIAEKLRRFREGKL